MLTTGYNNVKVSEARIPDLQEYLKQTLHKASGKKPESSEGVAYTNLAFHKNKNNNNCLT
jgi:hypothetical protein